MNRTSTLVLAVCGGLVLAACSKSEAPQQKASIENVKKEATELAASVKQLATQTKEDFVANAENELAGMDAKIKDLKFQADQAQGDAKAKLDKAVEQLEAQRQTATDKLKALKDASGDAWKDMKAGFNGAWDEMKKGYDAAKGS
jgi:archaellum component FlaC